MLYMLKGGVFMRGKRMIIIVGASGSGKTTVGNKLEERGIPRLITSTTRPMRKDEVDGVDYYFLTDDEIAEVAFVEQTRYNGFTYGLSVQSIEEGLANHDCVSIVMDKNGARAVKAMYPNETYVVYLAVTEEQMVERMMQRGETMATIQERVLHAEQTGEFDHFKEADIRLENLIPDENVEWVYACAIGGMTVG